jgi:AcrR family transcriptional regulator
MVNQYTEQEEQILEQGFESIAQTGVRSFTVESLASRLGMSKKTIYKYFPTKEKLIRKIVNFMTGKIERLFKKVRENGDNPVIQFVKVMEHISTFATKAPVQRLVQLKTTYPAVWKEIESFRLNRQQDFYEIFKSAQEQGLARSDVNMKHFSIVFINMVNNTFQPEFFLKNDLPIKDTVVGFANVVANGIFTEKGIQVMQTYKESKH